MAAGLFMGALIARMKDTHFGGVIFDCDGVLLDSNGVKADVFRHVLSVYSIEAIQAFEYYRQANPGLNRRCLFAHFFHEIVDRSDAEAMTERCVLAFRKRSLEALDQCRVIPGALELVRALNGVGTPCVVVSAADAADIDMLLARRGFAGLFKAVRGGDKTKADHIGELLRIDVLRRPLIYFGDSRADLEAAEAVAARFIMVSAGSDWSGGEEYTRERGHVVVTDLRAPTADDPALLPAELRP